MRTPDDSFALTRIADFEGYSSSGRWVEAKGHYINDGYGGRRWIPGEKLSRYRVFKKGTLLEKGAPLAYDTIMFNYQTNNGGLDAYYLTAGLKFAVKLGSLMPRLDELFSI